MMVVMTQVPVGCAWRIARQFVLGIGFAFVAGPLIHADSTPACKDQDCRNNFEAAIFTGVAVDSFAAKELKNYINPDESSEVRERAIGGFLIEYRLGGNPTTEIKVRERKSHQLWLYARTIHGMRSADVDCKANPDVAVCKDAFDPVNAPERNLFILRNATSLEAFMGLRYEIKSLQWQKESSAVVYFKAQAGFLAVSRSGGDVIDNHVVGIGIMAVNGARMGSRIEVGYGKTDLFAENPNHRIKFDGLLVFRGIDANGRSAVFRPFAQMTVDADGGHGADSIQTYLGFAFDFEKWSK